MESISWQPDWSDPTDRRAVGGMFGFSSSLLFERIQHMNDDTYYKLASPFVEDIPNIIINFPRWHASDFAGAFAFNFVTMGLLDSTYEGDELDSLIACITPVIITLGMALVFEGGASLDLSNPDTLRDTCFYGLGAITSSVIDMWLKKKFRDSE
jgi:hypothetical protein